MLDPKGELASAVAKAVSPITKSFRWSIFFDHWFRQRGESLFVLFRRNLSVTNVQYVELVSLLREHVVTENTATLGGAPTTLLFHTTAQLRELTTTAVNGLPQHLDRHQRGKVFADLYADVWGNTVLLDMFFSSCGILLPPGLRANLERAVAESGYIHSAGRTVYTRSMEKSTQREFYVAVKRHLEDFPAADKLPFIVYAHEDFSEHDRSAQEQMARGIQGTKLFLEKQNMGPLGLSDVVDGLRDRFGQWLFVRRPDHTRFATSLRWIALCGLYQTAP